MNSNDLEQQLEQATRQERASLLRQFAVATQQPDWAVPLERLAAEAPIYLAIPTRDLLGDLTTHGLHPRVPLFALCEMVECLVRFLSAARLVEIVAGEKSGRLPEELARSLRDRLQSPTFGKWREILATISAWGGAVDMLPELSETWAALNTLLSPAAGDADPETRDLIRLRNALAHGAGITAENARRLLAHWGPKCGLVFATCQWLCDLHLFAIHPAGIVALNGPAPLPVDATADTPARMAPGDVVMRRGGRIVSLSPFGRFTPVGDGTISLVQAFVRRGTQSLTYSLLESDSTLQAEGDQNVLETFERMLASATAGIVQGLQSISGLPAFERDFLNDATRFVGRGEELDQLWQAVSGRKAGVVWIGGPAGVGKSTLMSRLFADLNAEATQGSDQLLVLPYRFEASRANCNGGDFLAWAVERLTAAQGRHQHADRSAKLFELCDKVTACLQRATSRVVFVLDGLDELARAQPSFWSDMLPRLVKAAPTTIFVLAGRPEAGLPDLMRTLEAEFVFSGGLSGMNAHELRQLVDARLQRVAKKLVKQDQGDETVRNEFVAALVERSQGLPIYVDLVVRDVAGGRFRLLDAADAVRLPPSLVQYFDDLINDAQLSDDTTYQGVVGLLIAGAYEPLGIAEIDDLLKRRGFDAGDEQLPTIRRVLGGLGGLVRARYREHAVADPGFELYHTELKEHLARSPKVRGSRNFVHRLLADFALTTGTDAAASRYLFSHGIKHLLDAERGAEAVRGLGDFLYQLDRLEALGSTFGGDGGIRDDWSRIEASNVTIPEPAFSWRRFWATDGALFERGEARDAARELLERCLEYAPDTVMGTAVDAYLGR